MDEKTDLVVQFLNRCFSQSPAGFSSMILRMWEALEQEPMLAATSEDQRQEARKAVERAIFSEVKVNQGNCEHIFTLNVCRFTWQLCTPTLRQMYRGIWFCNSTLAGSLRWSVPTTGTSRFQGDISTSALGRLHRFEFFSQILKQSF